MNRQDVIQYFYPIANCLCTHFISSVWFCEGVCACVCVSGWAARLVWASWRLSFAQWLQHSDGGEGAGGGVGGLVWGVRQSVHNSLPMIRGKRNESLYNWRPLCIHAQLRHVNFSQVQSNTKQDSIMNQMTWKFNLSNNLASFCPRLRYIEGLRAVVGAGANLKCICTLYVHI